MSEAPVLTEIADGVGLVRLNRPQAMNALNLALMQALATTLERLDADPAVGCIVVTGNDKAFAAGADIKEMLAKSFADVYVDAHFEGWDRLARCRKPVIAAVAGYALGGGCEIAMMCDFIIAADNARFGQPEIRLGVLPGLGGTQRLARAVGKAKAMDLCLTGRMMDAAEAERSGLVARVVPAERLLEEALAAAREIAAKSRPAAYMVKEAVDRAYETTLAEGVRFEHRLFNAAFALEDRTEGMGAFVDKRAPAWRHR